MAGSLSNEEVARYLSDGYLFPKRLLTTDEAAAQRRELEEIEARYAADREVRNCMFSNCHLLMPFADRLCRHPAILDMVESIMGPDLMIWNSSFFIKEAGSDTYVSWHQDLTYWGLGPTEEEITVWVAFTPATVENGCMQFVAGSHKRDIVPHRDTFAGENLLTRGQEIAVDVGAEEAVDVCLQPGEVSLHHGRIFHASGPNRSNDRRIGLAIRYITPSVSQQVGDKDYAMLVRGEDRYGHFIPVTPPKGLFHPDDMARFRQIAKDEENYYYKDAAEAGKRA